MVVCCPTGNVGVNQSNQSTPNRFSIEQVWQNGLSRCLIRNGSKILRQHIVDDNAVECWLFNARKL